METKTPANNTPAWKPLEGLEASQYVVKEKTVGLRPTVKNLQEIDASSKEADEKFNKKAKEADKQVMAFLAAQEQEALEAKKEADEDILAKLKQEALQQAREELAKNNKLAKEDVGTEVKETLMGLGKLYVNSTNNLLYPIRFIMENKYMVFSALCLLILPALMTWFLTTEVSAITAQLQTVGAKVFYSFIFYFACMFALFTIIVLAKGIVQMLSKFLISAKEAGKTN